MRGVIVLAVAVSVIAAVVVYYTDSKGQLFLDIKDYSVTQSDQLLLSVTVSENIPRMLDSSAGYGYGWFASESGKLSGYAVNIHSESGIPQWHAESITVNDSEKFCFDDAALVQSSVVIDSDKLNVVIAQSKPIDVDRVVSYQIINDHSCHLGYAGVVVDQVSIKENY